MFQKTTENGMPLDISLDVNTIKGGGTLLYWNNEEEHLGLEIFAGRVRLSLRSPQAQTYTIYSHQVVDDGYKHKVNIKIKFDNVTMSVDKAKPRIIPIEKKKYSSSSKSKKSNRSKDTENSLYNQQDQPTNTLWVGGLLSKTAEEASKWWHLRNTTSFSGCISNLKFGNNPVDFYSAHEDKNIKPCNVCDICAPGGFCSGEVLNNCQCFPGYYGSHCEMVGSGVSKTQKQQIKKIDEGNKIVSQVGYLTQAKLPPTKLANVAQTCTEGVSDAMCRNGVCQATDSIVFGVCKSVDETKKFSKKFFFRFLKPKFLTTSLPPSTNAAATKTTPAAAAPNKSSPKSQT